MNPPPAQPKLPLTLPDGTALAEPLQMELARHSGVRFFEQHREAGEAVLQLLREGVPVSEVARTIGPFVGRPDEGSKDTGLRKLVERFGAFHQVKMGGVIAGRAAMVANEALAQMQEVMPRATHKELGALSMAATQATQIEREAAGVSLPPIRHVHLHVTPEDLERMEREASGTIIDA
jgi:hypothetical protein